MRGRSPTSLVEHTVTLKGLGTNVTVQIRSPVAKLTLEATPMQLYELVIEFNAVCIVTASTFQGREGVEYPLNKSEKDPDTEPDGTKCTFCTSEIILDVAVWM